MARLPSLTTLRIFAVAARHLSFTKAAEELHLTQSAVSHRVRALEQELKIPLFQRLARHVELTDPGVVLARQVEQAVNDIARTIAELDRTDQGGRLTVTMLPSVASRWLMPRLPRFRERCPDIDVQVIADARLLDLRTDGIDLAIRFGAGRYRDYHATALMQDFVLPVCSPRLIERHGAVDTVEGLLDLPLLLDSATEGDGSGSDWRSWLGTLGRSQANVRAGAQLNDAGLVIEGAVLGLGVGLARASLVGDHLAAGSLICPLPFAAPTQFAYFLLSLPEAAELPNIRHFREWVLAEARAMPTSLQELQVARSGGG
jgi:LysR family glycine cleavage system transcriptional activator